MTTHLLFKQDLLLFDAFEETVNGRKICTGLELVIEKVFHSSTSLRFDAVHIHCAYESPKIALRLIRLSNASSAWRHVQKCYGNHNHCIAKLQTKLPRRLVL